MSETWLKLIGTSEKPCREIYDKTYADFSKRYRPRDVHRGDRMVLYAAGGSKRIFALAEVMSEVYDITSETNDNSERETYPYRVNIKYIFWVPVSAGVHIDEITTPRRNLPKAIRRSYLKLKPEEFSLAESKLQKARLQYEARQR
jgi:hypothetical protein